MKAGNPFDINNMMLTPQPRFRFYGAPRNYWDFASALLTGRIGRDKALPSRLEKRICGLFGVPLAQSLPQARLGLYLAMRYLIRPGQTVLVSPYTYYEVINMVICAGGRPVFVDVEPSTCCIDARQLAKRIDDNTGAVIVSYIHGLVGDIEAIAQICRSRGVALIEDAAQCFGARVGGRYVGTFGDIGVYSFSHKKNVNAFLGGIAVTANQALHDSMATALKRFRRQEAGALLGRFCGCLLGELATAPFIFQAVTFPLVRYDILRRGGRIAALLWKENRPVLRRELPEKIKRRMNGLQAQIAERQLANVDRHTKVRIENARIYYKELAGMPRVGLPPFCENGRHIYLDFPIRITERRRLLRAMLAYGRDIERRTLGNNADFARQARDCPNARAVASQVVVLPTYPGYPRQEVASNIAAIRRFFGESAPPMEALR